MAHAAAVPARFSSGDALEHAGRHLAQVEHRVPGCGVPNVADVAAQKGSAVGPNGHGVKFEHHANARLPPRLGDDLVHGNVKHCGGLLCYGFHRVSATLVGPRLDLGSRELSVGKGEVGVEDVVGGRAVGVRVAGGGAGDKGSRKAPGQVAPLGDVAPLFHAFGRVGPRSLGPATAEARYHGKAGLGPAVCGDLAQGSAPGIDVKLQRGVADGSCIVNVHSSLSVCVWVLRFKPPGFPQTSGGASIFRFCRRLLTIFNPLFEKNKGKCIITLLSHTLLPSEGRR